jgi:ATP-dependent RNA helicase RhlE
MPFSKLGLRPELTRAVRDAGYEQPTPIQIEAIPPLLAGSDLIGVAQTGTGKTAAFVLPLLDRLTRTASSRQPRALIVAPTRELALQIEESLRNYSRHLRFRTAAVYGGVGEAPQIAALRRGVDIIVATPGRLIDLAGQGHLRLDQLEILVLDEADRMLDMGFLPAIRRIVAMVPARRQTLLFSATLSREIEQIAAAFLRDPVVVQIGRRSVPTETVTQAVHEVARDQKNELLIHLLGDAGMTSVIVFSRTKHGADKIARKLAAAGHSAATIHSNRSQAQRVRALQQFRSGAVRVLVATDIAARGIDVDGISHVVNFDFPQVPEDYVHRIGRTGRASAAGEALSFITPDDQANLRRVEGIVGRRIERRRSAGFVARSTPSLAPPITARTSRASLAGRLGRRVAQPDGVPSGSSHPSRTRVSAGRPAGPRGRSRA